MKVKFLLHGGARGRPSETPPSFATRLAEAWCPGDEGEGDPGWPRCHEKRRPCSGALRQCFPVWPNICFICWQPTCSHISPPAQPLLSFSPFSPLSLPPYTPNLCPAGRQWPNCLITLARPYVISLFMLISFPTLHSVLSPPYLSLSLCLPAPLSICPSFQQPHLSRCPSFHPITASALASQCLSASGYLSRAKHTHISSPPQ